MAIGRITGPLLASNLLRDGIDLQVENGLLYLDVTNGRIGVKTQAPAYDLDVNGTIHATKLIVDSTSTLGLLTVSKTGTSATISTVSGPLNITAAPNQTVFVGTNTTIGGDLHATGNITADGNITLGNQQGVDTLTIGAEIVSDILPKTGATYNIGSTANNWLNGYFANVIAGDIGISGNTIAPRTPGSQINIGATPVQDVNVTPVTNPIVNINGPIRVWGDNPLGTAPVVSNVLYVSMDGADTNDGRAADPTRACRTIKGATLSPFYKEGTSIKVAPGRYLEDNPIVLKPYTSVIGSDLRTTDVEPINKTRDLFHVNSGCYVAQMRMLNGRSGLLPGSYGYKEGNNRGAYATAFPPSYNGAKLDLFHSPYIQNVTNQSGPWLYDGTMFIPNQTVQIPEAVGTTSYSINTNSIVVTVSTGSIYVGQAVNAGPQDPGYFAARTLMLANKSFVAEQVIAYIDQTYGGPFQYEPGKCSRDTGLIVDGLALDTLYAGTSQTVFAGLQYWNQNGYVGSVGGEVSTTTAAVNWISSLTQSIILGQSVPFTYQNTVTQVTGLPQGNSADVAAVVKDFKVITDIITTGTTAVTDKIVPNGAITTASHTLNAYAALQANRSFLQAEAIAYVEANKSTGYTYNKDKCYRDTGLVVDALAQDLLFGGASQATFAGIQYWNQYNYVGAIASELTTTTNAIAYVSQLAQKIITNDTSGTRYQTTVTQVTSVNVGTLLEQNKLAANFGIILNVLNNGVAGITDEIVPNSLDTDTNPDVINAYALIQANKAYIKAEAIAYVENIKTGGFTYDQATCSRDVGYMLDSVSFDLLYGGNRQSVQSGVYYYGYSTTSSAIYGQQAQTQDAYNRIKSIVQDIILGIALPTTYQYAIPQVTTLTHGTSAEATIIATDIDVITNIINNGPSVVSAKTPIAATRSTDPHVIAAAKMLEANRAFIQADTIAYIDAKYGIYDQATCLRDSKLIVDALAFDMLYPTTSDSQLTFAALQYWNQGDYIKPVNSEITTTTNAILFLSKLAKKIVTGSTAGARYQSDVPQITTLTPATATEATAVANDFGTILTILNNGTAGVTDLIVPNSTASVVTNTVNAYNLLNANRTYMQSEVVAYVDAIRGTFPYNHVKCERDTRLIVDALVQDLLFTGLSQSTFAALSYWNQTSSSIPGEVSTTTNTINYISSLAQKVILNDTSGRRYQSAISQDTSITAATSAQATVLASEFATITDIIANGTAHVTDKIVPNDLEARNDIQTVRAYTILQANKTYLQAEAVAYVEATKTLGFTYNSSTCSRDIGYMVDSVSFDLLYNGNRQAIQSGVYYYNFDGTTATPNEVTQVVAAYDHMKSMVVSIIQGLLISSPYQTWELQSTSGLAGSISEVISVQTAIDTIKNIIQNGPGQAPPYSPISLTKSANPNVINAANFLHNNREFIAQEVSAFIDASYNNNTFTYNQKKCERDTGLIVDAIAQDLYFGGTSQSAFAGIQYWNQTAYTGAIGSEITTTTNAINYVSQLAQKIVLNDTSGQRYTTATQITIAGSVASGTDVNNITAEFKIITDVLTTGTTGVTNKIVPNSIDPTSTQSTLNAYALLQANKSYIQAEAVAYVESTKTPGFVYNQTKCSRDIGFMVDSISFDLKWGGNRQAYQSAVYYYNHNGNSSAIPGESVQVLDAYSYLKTLVGNIVAAIPVTPKQTTITQISNLSPGTNNEITGAQAKVDIITGIITNGPATAPAATSIPLTPSATASVYNAAKLLEVNRAFIQAEVTAYINQKYNVFTYDEAFCYRDTGYMIDSIAFDLLHGGNRQAVQSGVYYYGFNSSASAIPGEIPQTIAAYNRIKTIIGSIVSGQTIAKTPGNTYTQVTNLPIASQLQITQLRSKVDKITSIINIGPAIAGAATPISLTASTDPNAQKAFNYLLANRDFIAAEVVAYVNQQYGTAFQYDQAKCYRDVGYMIDCVSFDLLRGGNRQAIQAGTLYFGYDGNSTQLINELPQTVQAYEYLAKLVKSVVQSQAVSSFYQSDVPQVLNEGAAGSAAIATELVSTIELMSRIINDGPSVAPALIPISLTPSGSADRANAYALLNANRAFIVAELIAFTNTLPNFIYKKEKCSRDVAIIIENLMYDASFGGNAKAIETGLGYYNGVTSVIPNEGTQTVGAINYINTLANYIINNEVAPNLIGSTATYSQVINTAMVGGGVAADAISNGVDIVNNIITNGPSVAPESFIGCAVDPAYMSAEVLLQTNRGFIQDEVVEFVNQSFLNFPYNSAKCQRDTGLIVDAVAFDLLYPTTNNSQTTFAGIQYWKQNSYTGAIGDEISTTTNAISWLKTLAQKVILNDTTGVRYQNNTSQITVNGAPGTAAEVTLIGADFDIISEIINYNTVTGLPITDGIIPNGVATTSISINNAYALLNANRAYLQAETVAYVEATKTAGFVYDINICYRDAGYMVDSVAFDLLHGGNRQAVQSGVYYYTHTGGATQIPGQSAETIDAFNHIRDVAALLIRGQTVTPTSGNVTTPVVGLPIASVAEVTSLQSKFNNITAIISGGAAVAPDPTSISLTASSNVNIQRAFNILLANRDFLKAEMTAYVDDKYNNSGFTYNQDLCHRDVGLIVDAISHDILLGGNHKSIEAGVAYWQFAVNAVAGQESQTAAAYEYAKTICQKVVSNILVTNPLSTAEQTINTFFGGGEAGVPIINRCFDIILNIIENGPEAAPEKYDGSGFFVTRFDPIIDNVNFAPTVVKVEDLGDNQYRVGLSQNTVGVGTGISLYFGQTGVYPTLDKDVPENWAQRKIDPQGSMGGSLVDGGVISDRSPIQSFVYDAFTQLNQGGVGIKITNNGYAQLVSVFTIFCHKSVVVENGGICSITNSNANFGDYCLIAKGFGKLSFFGEVYNPPVAPYYPNGVFPQNQIVEVYCPDPETRPHIGLVMEVVAPEGYTNNQGLPGFLAANPTTSTLTTGTVTIGGIDNTGIAIGQSVFVRDQYGSYTDINGVRYASSTTVVSDVDFSSISLSEALLSGGGDRANPNYFTIYVAGNAYYTVLGSTLAPDPLTPGQSFISASVNSTGNDNTSQEIQAISYLAQISDKIAVNERITTLQNTATQTISLALRDGDVAVPTINTLFDTLSTIITGGLSAAPAVTRFGLTSDGAASAASLLLQNKKFIQAEILEYLDNQYFVYDHKTCARDLGYILDGFGWDAIYQSNYQARKCGNAYQRASSAYVLETEKPQTIDAIAHIASITANLSGINTVGSAISNITNGSTAIQNIISNGTGSQPALVLPDPPGLGAGLSSAKTLILQNINFLKAETVAWIDNKFPTFTYDSTKCKRDIGFVLDALAADIVTGSNYRSIKAGQAYYRGNGLEVIDNELTETVGAFNYVKGLVNSLTKVSASATATTAVIKGINTITNILTNGLGVSPEAVYPLPTGIDSGVASASQLIQGNLSFIQAEVEGYVNTNFGGFTYNETKCARDTGLIVDAIAQDILFNGTSQSQFAGLQYWNQNGYTGAIASELTTTTNAISYVSSLAQKVILNDTSGVRYQSAVSQNTGLPAASAAQATSIATDFGVILNILNNGTAGVTDIIVPNGLTSSANVSVQYAYAILQANKAYLEAEAVAFVEATKTVGFTYNQSTCARDVGYMIDSVSVDLLYGGNRQAVQSGVYYYGFSGTSSAIPNESIQTLQAYNHIKAIVPNIVQGIAITTYQSAVSQVTNLTPGGASQGNTAQAKIDVITNIITNGPTAAGAKTPIGLIQSANGNDVNAAILLEANRAFIQAEVIAYINATYPSGFTYNRDKCKRDVKFLTQALIYDLTYGGNSMSVDAALNYWDNSNNNVSFIPNERVQTAAAINYINTVLQKVIRNTAPTTSYSTATQYINTGLTLGANADSTIAGLVTSMSNIVSSGPGAAPLITDISVNAPATVSAAAIAIEENKYSIASQTITWINETYNIFTYNKETCKRDIQFIVESMLYDLVYGGNWQTVDAGLQYWKGTVSKIPNEINQTASSIFFINDMFDHIVNNTQPASYYQQVVTQYINPLYVGGADALPKLLDLTSIITKIIRTGTSAAPTIVYPTASAQTVQLANVQTVINTNKTTLTSQTITYIDNTYNGFEYNKKICKRDVGLIIDAIANDLTSGGNYNTVLAGQSYFSRANTHHYVQIEDNVADATLFPDKNRVNFYQRSYMSASGYLFEYVGAGSNYGALPQVGRADPIQAHEVIQLNNGKVFFTSTDQNGDFRIGPGLVISQATGVLSGRTFTKSLFANLTPFILAIEG